MLKKILIASVLIQASWFIMMVLVDLSTVLTYSIWWLPYSILKDQTLWSWDDAKMFKMNVDFELWDYTVKPETQWDISDAIRYYWQMSWDQYIAPCETAHVKFWWWDEEQSFAIGRKFIDLGDWYKMMAWYCMYYWALLSYNEFYVNGASTVDPYRKIIEKDGNESTVKELVEKWIIFPLSNWKISYLPEWKTSGWSVSVDGRTFWNNTNSNECNFIILEINKRLKEISNKGKCGHENN